MQLDQHEQLPTGETLPEHPERPYAILRIKRKRNEEPLDGLGKCHCFLSFKRCAQEKLSVVDPEAVPRRKRSRGALNFFKFAATVEQNAWDDEKQKKDLQVCELSFNVALHL